MTSVGITGHMDLPPSTRRAVAREIAALLAPYDELAGWTALAPGSDQVFAWSVLAAGGSLVFVAPSADIEDGFSGSDLEQFRALRALSTRTIAPAFEHAGEDAYLHAGRTVAEEVDLLVAVWDGSAARGRGGTADIVAYRRDVVGNPLAVVWPAGSFRG